MTNNNHEWAMNSQAIPNDRQIRSSEITPPHELVQQWVSLAGELEGFETWQDLATQAACWGADWQLKQVIEWLNNNLGHSNYLEPLWPYKIDVDGVLYDLKEAMRPQQQEES